MKKSGFTLAEVLISLSIIGIVAAITAPTLINIMPNKDKVMTIKYHKLISDINSELLNNTSLYPDGKWDNSEPLDPEYSVFLDNEEKKLFIQNKYAFLLSKKLEIEYADFGANQAFLKTTDGCQWEIKTNSGTPTSIIVDTNGEKEAPNAYGDASQKYPDKFAFLIDEKNGYAGCDENNDKITCRYLYCPYYLNNRKLDYDCITAYTDDTANGKCACK